MFRKTLSAALMALGLAATQAAAQSTPPVGYSKNDVVSFMAGQVDQGAARAIGCIGTRTECEAKKAKPKGFDMLLTFDLDSAELRPEARKNLDVIASALQDGRLRTRKFRVEGYTDARGSDAYNLSLSARRANAVSDYLMARNVSAERLVAVGLGKSSPRTGDPFDPDNRRVELKLGAE